MFRFLTVFALSSLFISSAFPATIKGIVKDKTTGEGLISAVVFIKETKKHVETDLEGRYTLSNVSPGQYTLVSQYMGYVNLEIPVTVNAEAEELSVDFDMHHDFHETKAVEVVGQTDKESDEDARKSEKGADNITNVMSAKTIQMLPDINVGNVLQRVSGVSMVRNASGDGQYAIIRGMDKAYNYTLVNGIKIPSPDNKNRYVPMDIFPADLLERLEVIKALTPSNEGDAIGGVMNMIMKSAPQTLTINGNAAIGYSDIFSSQRPYSGFQTNSIISKSPNQIHGPAYNANAGDFSLNNMNYSNKNYPLNTVLGFSIGNRVFQKKLGFLVAGSYQRIFRGTDETFYHSTGPGTPTAGGGSAAPFFDEIDARQYSILQTRAGIHAKLDYNINEKNKLSWYNMYVQMDEQLHRNYHWLGNSNATGSNAQGYPVVQTEIHDRSRYTRQSIYNSTLKGEHSFFSQLKFDWSAVYSLAVGNTPDWTDMTIFPTTTTYPGGSQITTQTIQNITKIWTNNRDQDLAAYTNVSYSPKKFLEFTTGGLTRFKNRKNMYNDYVLNVTVPSNSPLSAGGQNPNSQNFTTIDNVFFDLRPGTTPAAGDSANGNNYTFDELIASGYGQAKVTIAQKLQILGGIRIENTFQEYKSKLTPTKPGRNGTITYSDPLPSIHLKYSINQKQNLRLSYYRAIRRPSYFELIPATTPGDQFDEVGNYLLKHTTADNYDLRYEFFPRPNEQFLLGVFYKNIQNPIEQAFIQNGNNSYLTGPQNFGNATNYGFEMVVTKYIKNWGITANYTYTQSSITTTKKTLTMGDDGKVVNGFQDQTRPLQGQSDHIANVSLIYKMPKIALDVQVTWGYTGERIVFVSDYLDNDWWQRGLSQFDISAEKRFGRFFSLYAKATNLLNTPIIIEIRRENNVPNDPEQTRNDRILVQKDVFNQTFLLGARFKFQP
jgi:TonB-dependent receptor